MGGIFLILSIAYYFCLPDPLFEKPVSLVLEDRKHQLLGARIAEDGQWRFPFDTSVSAKFEKCIIAFEDKRFYSHPGVDPLSVGRAVFQNTLSLRKVSGASTLSMQVIRLSRNRERTFSEKVIEAILATRLELRYNKKEILALYASNAPFGGNVVGLSAASWRYYGKSPVNLSWGEAAALAVLPNSPSIVHPGKNRQVLQRKRDRLLDLLLKEGIVDSSTVYLAKLEPLPDKPKKLPLLAPHLLTRIYLDKKRDVGKIVHSTVDIHLQQKLNHNVHLHHEKLKQNSIHNIAAIIVEVRTGNVLAYTGNDVTSSFNAEVDNVCAARSTGSILKPLLFASMMQDGKLLPDMLVKDVPIFINNYTPKNFNYTYDGAVPASKALARSLNIPAVHMLQSYSPEKFVYKLKQMGLTTIHRPASAYGLSLILGGAEANLSELAGVYAGMARILNFYNATGKYRTEEFRPLNFYSSKIAGSQKLRNDPQVLSAASIWTTFDALLKVSRPDDEKFWAMYTSSKKIAWKTGTSFGDRDAWAIGCTPEYVVAVWAGNSNGEGRPGLTGIASAAPLLFDIFNMLPSRKDWFFTPLKDMEKVLICKESGCLASDICPETKEVLAPSLSTPFPSCAYHHMIHLDFDEQHRVHGECEAASNMKHKPWFVLPPSMEKYYKATHPSYVELPPYRKDCSSGSLMTEATPIDLLYPQNFTQIYIPVKLNGSKSSIVFEAAHNNLSATIHWHIDENFIGSTRNGIHQKSFTAQAGMHKLTLVDDAGNSLTQDFRILKKR